MIRDLIPNLGKYATEVTLAYGLTLLCLAALIAQSFLQSRKIKRALRQEEETRKRNG